jgi:hypothetical protein
MVVAINKCDKPKADPVSFVWIFFMNVVHLGED